MVHFNRLYHALRAWFGPLVPFIIPRYFPKRLTPPWMLKFFPTIAVEDDRLKFITANVITIFRTVLIIPIGVLLHLDLILSALSLFVLGGILDFVDGLVATVHRKMKYKDNPEFGAFLDAFCDKFYFAGNMGSILLLANYQNMPISSVCFLLLACSLALFLEIWLAVIRVSDFYYNAYHTEPHRDLRAKNSGKLKYMLELIGLGGLMLALPLLDSYWSAYAGISALIASIPFARQSLQQKLTARKPAL